MVFLGDAIHLTVSSAPINMNRPISHPLSGCSKARFHFTFIMTQMQFGSFHMLPRVSLSGCVASDVHRFSTFSNSALRFYGWWTMQYQSHSTVLYMSSVNVYPVVFSHKH
jgi:hypothetical protein